MTLDPTAVRIEATINGIRRELEFESNRTVLELLRGDLDLLGTREGCGVGACGSCTVLVDGNPISSCILLAANLDGREVLTIEGLGKDGELDPVQRAFLDQGAFQCGFCTPGMILAVKALVAQDPRPTPEEVREFLAGNICRCGTYAEVSRAVEALLDRAGNRPLDE